MKPSLFTNLPSEIIPNILSRLSVRSIAISKCVCKAWLDLLVTRDFINSHLSKSAPALAVMMPMADASRCKVFELEDELDLCHGYAPLTKFDFPYEATIEGSANGLLFLHNLDADFDIFYETWCMDRVISVKPYYGVYGFAFVQPIEVFGNCDILMLCDAKIFMYYSNKILTAPDFLGAKKNCITSAMLFTPTLVSLQSLGMENVISF
ncbi:F-box protein CPR1-like [Salvia divinorum]|uniref:F-box protein CPR1-like n=1 Tax=Salvia divinorum TaxID=28513 RepID=A0ABD1HXM0_SALDI